MKPFVDSLGRPPRWWEEDLLRIIPTRFTVKEAMEEIGVSKQLVHWHLKRDPELMDRYKRAMSYQAQNREASERRVLAERIRKRDSGSDDPEIKKEVADLKRWTRAVSETGGNVRAACRSLGINHITIYRKMWRDPSWFRPVEQAREAQNG